MIIPYKHTQPLIAESALIFESADIVADVTIGEDCSVWSNATVRGDMAPVMIGNGSNIQDNAVVHVNTDMPTHIGRNVTIAHSAIIHGCTVNDNCLIGMGAILLNEAVIQEDSIVGAGSLVTARKSFPPRSLIMGSPAKAVRQLTDEEVEGIRENALHYQQYARDYLAERR
ncbi:MAG: gamma carbonic anhydrase family protein [Spirochaetia bacterium]|nr:gamma carbonic anhydrase family protein [Spirochaetia bacterium]